jgi:hypothetical protein
MNEFQLCQHRLRLAELSVGGTTVRGMPTGTTKAARSSLRRTRLYTLPTTSRSSFVAWLDQQTRRIAKSLPEPSWGVARKVLNIFIRSCVYDAPIRAHFHLAAVESWLEVPLDQGVGAGIRACSGEDLPRFANKHLTPSVNAGYQAAARRIARRAGTKPIHLESCWWRVEPGRCVCARGLSG